MSRDRAKPSNRSVVLGETYQTEGVKKTAAHRRAAVESVFSVRPAYQP